VERNWPIGEWNPSHSLTQIVCAVLAEPEKVPARAGAAAALAARAFGLDAWRRKGLRSTAGWAIRQPLSAGA